MTLNHKPVEAINEDDLRSLITDEVSESKTIEYKQSLNDCLSSKDSKKEFLHDVASFANAAGGHLIYGMKEEAGKATELIGDDIKDIDSQLLSLEHIIRDNISPRIPGLAVHGVPLTNGKFAIVIRIPRSWARPHMVNLSGRFFSRDGRGKYPLDVGQLRAAFALSETTAEHIRNFRQERLGSIFADEIPVVLEKGAKMVLHIVPIGAFDFTSQFDVIALENKFPRPLDSDGGCSRKLNFDGLVTFDQKTERRSSSYLQVFRNGIIEAVDTNNLIKYEGRRLVDPNYESMILEGIAQYLKVQSNLGVEPPLFIMLSFLGVRGYEMAVDDGWGRRSKLIDRDALLINEIMLESFDVNFVSLMKPSFDIVWNSTGYSRSPSYDQEGNWIGRRLHL